MRQRISYFKNNNAKRLKDLIFENFTSFREWSFDTEIIDNDKLKDYLNESADFKKDFDMLDKKMIDELTSEFIGYYCDVTDQEGKILEFFGPAMSKWRYSRSEEMVKTTQDEEFISLWNFLMKGRSLKDNHDFDSFTNDFAIGFLTESEYKLLKEKIETHFGNIETMRKNYWTDKEKKDLENAIANGSYSLTGHNPKSSGLEYVLTAINELNDYNKELITGIE